jgi:NNP family nitrate/nitrite transporter-like MFS transporter
VGVGLAVQNPGTPYWVLLLLAASAGLGGGNFAAFMSSTSFFYPKRQQGTALGVQAGIGNFGVSLAQFLTPLVITLPLFGSLGGAPVTASAGAARAVFIQNAAFIWVLPVAIVAVAAALYLRSIPVRATAGEQAVIFRRKHTWVMTSLYLMTFGTFSGFSASFALLIREIFGGLPDPPDPLRYAFLGALIGSATRPVAGWISDRIGGAIVTLVSGALLLGASLLVPAYAAPNAESFGPFLALVLVIFFASGVGNGSTFRMIPVIFPSREAGPVLGWTSAIGAYGAFLVPMLFSASLSRTGRAGTAFVVLAVFYAANLALCYWYYGRKGAERPC